MMMIDCSGKRKYLEDGATRVDQGTPMYDWWDRTCAGRRQESVGGMQVLDSRVQIPSDVMQITLLR